MARAHTFLLMTVAFLLLLSDFVDGKLLNQRKCTSEDTENGAFPKDCTMNWRAAPKGRGTFALLFNCSLTLFLCVWTTVLVNIEPVGLVNTSLVVKINIVRKFFARREVRKLGWSAVSLLLPEVTVLIATYEKWVAKRLKEKMLQQFPDDQENPVRWGSDYLELPYFVIMGGFRVELERPDGPQASAGSGNFTGYQCVSRTNGQSCYCMDPWPLKSLESDDSNHQSDFLEKVGLTLTPYGALFLAKNGLFPDKLTVAEIRARSKAGTLTKAIVVLQASWMLIQVLARFGNRMTVSLLEVHVCVHVLLSLTKFFIWWGKPVDVELQEPIYVTRDVLLKLQHPEPNTRNAANPFIRHKDRQHTATLADPPDSVTPGHGRRTESLASTAARKAGDPTVAITPAEKEYDAIAAITPEGKEGDSTSASTPARKDSNSIREIGTTSNGSPSQMESQVTEPSTRPSDRYLTTRAGLGKLLYLQLFENARATRLGDWLSFAHARQAYTKLIGSWDNLKAEWVMLSFIAMVYGGLHLATWRGPFLTQFEEWTWKVGSLLTAITTVSVMVSVILGAFLEKRWKGERFTEMYKLLCAILLGLGIGPVIFTRLFLFVECFITLREVRADTYAVVDWAETWPHMG